MWVEKSRFYTFLAAGKLTESGCFFCWDFLSVARSFCGRKFERWEGVYRGKRQRKAELCWWREKWAKAEREREEKCAARESEMKAKKLLGWNGNWKTEAFKYKQAGLWFSDHVNLSAWLVDLQVVVEADNSWTKGRKRTERQLWLGWCYHLVKWVIVQWINECSWVISDHFY